MLARLVLSFLPVVKFSPGVLWRLCQLVVLQVIPPTDRDGRRVSTSIH